MDRLSQTARRDAPQCHAVLGGVQTLLQAGGASPRRNAFGARFQAGSGAYQWTAGGQAPAPRAGLEGPAHHRGVAVPPGRRERNLRDGFQLTGPARALAVAGSRCPGASQRPGLAGVAGWGSVAEGGPGFRAAGRSPRQPAVWARTDGRLFAPRGAGTAADPAVLGCSHWNRLDHATPKRRPRSLPGRRPACPNSPGCSGSDHCGVCRVVRQ